MSRPPRTSPPATVKVEASAGSVTPPDTLLLQYVGTGPRAAAAAVALSPNPLSPIGPVPVWSRSLYVPAGMADIDHSPGARSY